METSGGSERFRRFLVEDLIPLVEDSYPCDPGSRTLIGHSLAGLFTVLMLLQAPGTFRNYVSISPSLWWAPKALHRELDLLASRLSPEAPARRVLLAVGEYEQSLAPWHPSGKMPKRLRSGGRTAAWWTGSAPSTRDSTLPLPASRPAWRCTLRVITRRWYPSPSHERCGSSSRRRWPFA